MKSPDDKMLDEGLYQNAEGGRTNHGLTQNQMHYN